MKTKRYIIVVVSVLIGIACAGFDLMHAIRHFHHTTPAVPGQLSPEEDRFIFEACIEFYGAVYTSARLLYRLIGRKAEAAELRQWSKWHLRLLNAGGGLLLLGSNWRDYLSYGVLRPSLLIAVAMGVYAVVDTVEQRRADARRSLRAAFNRTIAGRGQRGEDKGVGRAL